MRERGGKEGKGGGMEGGGGGGEGGYCTRSTRGEPARCMEDSLRRGPTRTHRGTREVGYQNIQRDLRAKMGAWLQSKHR